MTQAGPRKIIVGITGSSAPIYGIRTLQVLRAMPDIETHLVLSEGAHLSIKYEAPDWSIDDIIGLADVYHDPRNLAASISSGSFKTGGMVVVPCSMKTLASIAHSYNVDLITRAADVCLKERRRLVIVARETPFHRGHLMNMLAVTDMGGVILPPIPGFYSQPKTIDDIINHTVGKILDLLDIENEQFKRWTGEEPD
jgi:polyprenyl P-hydroxybenzoate/phenylacrylic acid decarboxylase-like protein